jgi:phospholipid/cholesterol/gamma-HCH transport system substrate-binding protein
MNNQRQLLLGIFFIVALSILAFYTLFLTDIHLFSKPILMTVYFEDANNLREGDPVQLLGARIGRVKTVAPNIAAETKRRIRTELSLDSKIELLEDATISIRETSLLGGRHVFIHPGEFGGPLLEPLEDGSYYGQVHKNPIASLGDIGRIFNENSESISQTFANFRTISDNIAQGKGLLGRIVSDEDLGEDGRRIVAETRTFMENAAKAVTALEEGKGLAGALLYDETIKQQFADTMGSLSQIGDDLRNPDSVLGALINDKELRDRVVAGIDSFVSFGEKLDKGEGALGMLTSDVETKEQVKTLIANLSSTSEDLKVILADVREGKGTVGKLMADDSLFNDLRSAVAVLTRSLEDYREAAPITSFTSVLFAAF